MIYQTQEFHLGHILTITTGYLLPPPEHEQYPMDAVYEILNFMTGESLFTHALPRCARECEPYLLKQHPQLASITIQSEDVNTPQKAVAHLKKLVDIYGEYFQVTQIPRDDHDVIDPTEEAIKLVGKNRVISIDLGNEENE